MKVDRKAESHLNSLERSPDNELPEPRHRDAQLEVVCGPMMGGKTDELIRRITRTEYSRKYYAKLFKPQMDHRFEGSARVNTHDGEGADAVAIDENKPWEIVDFVIKHPEISMVGIDEGQFFSEEIIEVCDYLVDVLGIKVIIAGLDVDFRGEPFGSMPTLLAKAKEVQKLYGYCVCCGEQGDRTQRMIKERINGGDWSERPANYDDPIILVGAGEEHELSRAQEVERVDYYEQRCRRCHEVPGKPGGTIYQANE